MQTNTRGRGPGSEHETRRREIVDAVIEVAGAGGLEAVNVREVADCAGVSLGRVQHYFPSKSDLMTAAFDQASGAATTRITERLATEPAKQNPLDILGLIVDELIPEQPERQVEMGVAFAFTARALTDPALAAQLRRGYAEIQALISQLLTEGEAKGQFELQGSPDEEADHFLALVEGLGVHVLLGHRTSAAARRLILRSFGPS